MLVDRVIIFAISFHPIFLMPCLHPIYLHKLALMMYKSIYWVKILSIVNIYILMHAYLKYYYANLICFILAAALII